MKPPSDPEVGAWLAKADGDLRMVQLAADADALLWDHVCFHSQQAAEKCLKALMTACDLDVPRTHDLVFLIDSLSARIAAIRELEEDAAVLTQHGVAPGYPNLLAAETETEARNALQQAVELCACVRFLGIHSGRSPFLAAPGAPSEMPRWDPCGVRRCEQPPRSAWSAVGTAFTDR